MLKNLKPIHLPEVKVVQLVGGTGTEKSSAVGPLLATILADKLGCACHYLHAPLVTDTLEGRQIIMRETAIQESLGIGRQSRIALTGIGSTNPEIYNPYKMGYVSSKELEEIRRQGAVGTVCGRLKPPYR
jgi:deoxyribonucleoside regulator